LPLGLVSRRATATINDIGKIVRTINVIALRRVATEV
jgi:hypothetical protein